MELFTMLFDKIEQASPPHPPVIALAGGGGKSTTLYRLAESAARRGKNVLITTTTKMFDPRIDPTARFHRCFIGETVVPPSSEGGSITFAADAELPELRKVKGYERDRIGEFRRDYDLIIVEADGAKRLPLKAPGSQEPQIPACTTHIIAVIGLDSYEAPMDENHVHRPECFASLTGCRPECPVTAEHYYRLATHSEGAFKSAPPHARRFLLFNKLDVLNKDRAIHLKESLERLFLRSEGGEKGIEVLLGSMMAKDERAQIMDCLRK